MKSSTGLYGGTRTYTSGTFFINNQPVTATANSPQTITHNAYWFNVNDYKYSQETNPIENRIYNMLCVDIDINNNGENNPNYTPYWISDKCGYVREDFCQYYMHYMGDLHHNGKSEMGGVWLNVSSGGTGGGELHVLPIVQLDSSACYKYNQQNEGWDISVY